MGRDRLGRLPNSVYEGDYVDKDPGEVDKNYDKSYLDSREKWVQGLKTKAKSRAAKRAEDKSLPKG